MKRTAGNVALALTLGLVPVAGRPQTIDTPLLSLEGARTVIVAAKAEASSAGADVVTYLPGDKVQAAFAKGIPLMETGTYKVHASRRDRDGQAEVHDRDTDILYVLEGTATLVTGGQVVNGKVTAADELRGDAISGGDVRRLGKGDLVIVPNGVPHLFKDVNGPFLYYVVKVTAAKKQS